MKVSEADLADAPMACSWRAAAADLGIRFLSPFAFEANGVRYACTGLLPDFGGPKGTLVCSRFDPIPDDVNIYELAHGEGYYTSGLNPRVYETYERARFVETLDDWGWYGQEGAAPTWFGGAQYRHGGRPSH
jgi:hypothetical protein